MGGCGGGSSRPPENGGTVFGKERQLGLGRIAGDLQYFSRVGTEVFGHTSLRQLGLEGGGKKKAVVVIKRNQAPIKCRIVQAREAESVSHIEPFLFVLAPWQNVRSDQKFAN